MRLPEKGVGLARKGCIDLLRWVLWAFQENFRAGRDFDLPGEGTICGRFESQGRKKEVL
jgi:hypothetical protein